MISMEPKAWQALSLSVLSLVVLAAMVIDVRERRIPNQVVLTGLIAGVVLHTIGPQAGLRVAGLFTLFPGALGVTGALLGALVGFLAFVPFYIFRIFGAGDVKLMTAVGSFAGIGAILNISLFVLLAGGVLGFLHVAWKRNFNLIISNGLAIVRGIRSGSSSSFDPVTQSAWRMPYSLAVALGLLGYSIWIFSGNFPLLDF